MFATVFLYHLLLLIFVAFNLKNIPNLLLKDFSQNTTSNNYPIFLIELISQYIILNNFPTISLHIILISQQVIWNSLMHYLKHFLNFLSETISQFPTRSDFPLSQIQLYQTMENLHFPNVIHRVHGTSCTGSRGKCLPFISTTSSFLPTLFYHTPTNHNNFRSHKQINFN